jgi:hypothetical protein
MAPLTREEDRQREGGLPIAIRLQGDREPVADIMRQAVGTLRLRRLKGSAGVAHGRGPGARKRQHGLGKHAFPFGLMAR